MKKRLSLITPDIIEECLSESLDTLEKSTPILKKSTTSHIKIKRPLK